jgi:diguanylate cyclase (GGDEF)-like protein
MARVRSGLRLQRALSELSRKNELLERLALTDPLTDLANRRAFSGSMEAEMARARRSGKGIGLLFLDLDRFKAVNDGHGHAVGDEVLVAVADLLRRHGRRGDLTARMGGEEFAVLLPETESSNALVVAERIRKAVEAEPVGRTVPLSVTVSIGVAVAAAGSTESPESLLARADAALYRAKGAGRNRVEAAPPPETQPPVAP